MKQLIILAPLFLLFLLTPAYAAEESLIPSLVEKFNQSDSAADGAVVFKNCAALNNALLNAYKDSDRVDDDELPGIIDEYSLKSAKYVEIASIFTLRVAREEAEKTAEKLGIVDEVQLDDMVSIFDENYYDLLGFYMEALQNMSLRVVEIDNNLSAFVADIGYSVGLCEEVLAEYCELNSLSNCSIL